MKVVWLHNNPSRASGTFMWDIVDRLAHASPGIDVEDCPIPLMRRKGAFREALRNSRIENADIVHAQYGALVGALATMSEARAYIVSLRGSDSYWRYGTLRDRVGGLARCMLSWFACLRSDAVIVMSHQMAARVRRWWGLRRRLILVISDPAGEIFWPAGRTRIFDALLSRNFSVMTASLQHGNPIKRTEIVNEAARLCQAAGMAVELQILSGIPREEVRDHFERADSIALASTHEGWPNVIKEALLLGKTFVATNVGDLASYALPGSRNQIVGATPIEFACAWVDQIAAAELQGTGVARELVPFHPDVVALKLKLLYLHVGGS